MKLVFSKRMKIAAGAVCAVVALSAGAALLSHDDVAAAKISKTKTSADSSLSAAEKELSHSDEVTTEQFSFMTFKKAPVESYDMHYYVSEKAKKKIIDPDDFWVEFPKDEGEYYDVKNDPLNFTETRSIAGEYYTVHDEITGTTQTLNAYDLVCQAIYNEVGDGWGNEAIKAQAVACYTWVRYNDEHGLIPTVGLRKNPTSKITSCVKAVEGQIVSYGGKTALTVYSASSAGYSTSAKNIWGQDHPYLQRVLSEFDNKDPNWGVEKKYTKAQVAQILKEEAGIEPADDITKWFTVKETYSSKYIKTITLGGQNEVTKDISGGTLCGLFGLKSTAMDINFKNGVFTFKTYGWGHGVGMSQWGACYYAEAGYTYDQILTHYYINTTLTLSGVNSKAISRSSWTQEQLSNEANTSETAVMDPTGQTVTPSSEQAQQPAEQTPASTDTAEQPAPEEQTDQPAQTTVEQQAPPAAEEQAEQPAPQTEPTTDTQAQASE